MSRQQMEKDLMIYSWGLWARPNIDRMLGAKEAPWAYLMDTDSGYDSEPNDLPPRADNDWCERIDRIISRMGKDTQYVMVGLYCLGVTVNRMAKHRRPCGKRLSKSQVADIRDACLNQLYGAIYLSKAG